MDQLKTAARKLGINLTTVQQRLFSKYFQLLESKNSKINLTGIKGWVPVRDELMIRSMSVLAPALGAGISTAEWMSHRKILDIGTGAGIPGLIIKFLCPETHVTLLDSSSKKISFLREVIEVLAIKNVDLLHGRAEHFAHENIHREEYDLVVSRGVAKLPELAELTLPFASVGGTVISVKGSNVSTEIEQSELAAAILGSAPALSRVVERPGGLSIDTLVYWLKIKPTPPIYPRRNGVPHSNPLSRDRNLAE